MADGIRFKVEFKINLVLMFIQSFEALSHSWFWITWWKRRPTRVPLKAITEMPSKPRPLLIDSQAFRAPREEVLISTLPARIQADQILLSILHQPDSLLVIETFYGEFSNWTTKSILIRSRVSLLGRRKPTPWLASWQSQQKSQQEQKTVTINHIGRGSNTIFDQ